MIAKSVTTDEAVGRAYTFGEKPFSP
jgi:hypothetical protein